MNIFIKSGKKLLSFRSIYIFFIFIGVLIIFGFLSPEWSFLKWPNVSTLLRTAPELGLVTLGMTLLLISGEFDLSVGSMLAFCSMVAAVTFTDFGWNPFLGLSLALAFGALFGFVNGLIVTKTRVSSLIVTLGTMWAFRGLLLTFTGGFPVFYHPEDQSQLFKDIFVGEIWGIPIQIFWLIAAAIILYMLLEHTGFGNRILATGSNEQSARMMGINTDRVKIICFMILGVLVAFAAVMQSCRIGGAYGNQGAWLNLKSIGGSVVGGTTIYGGVGTISGGALGALMVKFLDSGLISIGLEMWHFRIALGAMLIIVVSINVWLRGKRT